MKLNGYLLSLTILSASSCIQKPGSSEPTVSASPVAAEIEPATTPYSFSLRPSSLTEGVLSTSLLTISITGDKKITEVSIPNLHDLVTVLTVNQDWEKVNVTRNPGYIFEPLDNDGNVEMVISGAAKFSTSHYSLAVEITYEDESQVNESTDISINGLGLPYLKYDIFSVKKNGSSSTSHATIVSQGNELRRMSSGWRTPILTDFRDDELECSGTVVSSYDSTNSTLKGCIHDNVKIDSETVFVFSEVYRGAVRIGGVATGVRGGVVIEGYPLIHVMSHELGHNLGLWHTHETSFNKTLRHEDSNGLASRGLYRYKESDSSVNYQDFAPYILTKTGVSGFNFSSISDDTDLDPYNSRTVTLYDPSSLNSGYSNGDIVQLYYGNQSPTSSGYTCRQSSWSSGSWNFVCNTGFSLTQSLINNVMSYWTKLSGSASFSSGQKSRMDEVLSQYSEITER